ALMDRFNEVFLRHDPTALPGLIAESCVIEKISPAPNADRCIGPKASIALWTPIATAPGPHFHPHHTLLLAPPAPPTPPFSRSATALFLGVYLMLVNGGLVVEESGYVKSA